MSNAERFITEELLKSAMEKSGGNMNGSGASSLVSLGLVFSVLEEMYPDALTLILLKYPEVGPRYAQIADMCRREAMKKIVDEKFKEWSSTLSKEERELFFAERNLS